jgi:hypothetical protein
MARIIGPRLIRRCRPCRNFEPLPPGANIRSTRPQRPALVPVDPNLMRQFQSRLRGSPETETVSQIPILATETVPRRPCDVHDTFGAVPMAPRSANKLGARVPRPRDLVPTSHVAYCLLAHRPAVRLSIRARVAAACGSSTPMVGAIHCEQCDRDHSDRRLSALLCQLEGRHHGRHPNIRRLVGRISNRP